MSTQYERVARARMKTGSYKAKDETKFNYSDFATVAEVPSGSRTWKQLEVPVLNLCPRLVAQMRGAGTLGANDDKVVMFLNAIERKPKADAPAASRQEGGAPSGGPPGAFDGEPEDDSIPF